MPPNPLSSSPTSTIHSAYNTLLTRGRLTPNPHQAALITRLSTLQHDLLHSPSPTSPINGVYIYGSVGTGKTRLADLFASTLPRTIPHRRLHFHEFMMDIHSRLHVARSSPTFRGDPLLSIGSQIRSESRVLCFDEFQVTDIADAMILKRLFGAFWAGGGVMVATSNREPGGLYENGLNRGLFLPFIEVLRARCEVWRMEGSRDYRMGNGGGEKGKEERAGVEEERVPVFFTDEQAFEADLQRALDGAPLHEKEIPVLMSRKLHVQAATPPIPPQDPNEDSGDTTTMPASNKVLVSATFSALCETYLGSADYHALCKSAHTIYLSGLRRFRADQLDYIRRFITLVDLAYESRVRIVVLSTVPLFEVFSNILPNDEPIVPVAGGSALGQELNRNMTVKGEGGSSSSMMSTFIGEMEWSATGLAKASLASGGAGETDVRFAIGRAVSRLFEMGSRGYGVSD